MEYIILSDVSADLDLSIPANQEVGFLRMDYSFNGEMRRCDGPESREVLKDFYNGQRKGDLTKTSQITPFLYEEYLRPYFEKGLSVICLTLSSGLSSTYHSALMAKAALEEEFPGQYFYPVDSLAATGGMGVLTERALRNKAAGMTLEDNYEDLVSASHKIRHWFLVQDLMYLKRGGRVSGATAVVGTALNIKPVLRIAPDGKLETIAKKRGNKMAARHLVELFQESYDPQSEDVIYIIDADDESLGEALKAEVAKLYPNAVIRRSGLSPIIGAHTGPGMAAICHMGK